MIICTNCSHQNGDDDVVCGSCDEPLAWYGQKVPDMGATPRPDPSVEPPPIPPPAPPTSLNSGAPLKPQDVPTPIPPPPAVGPPPAPPVRAQPVVPPAAAQSTAPVAPPVITPNPIEPAPVVTPTVPVGPTLPPASPVEAAATPPVTLPPVPAPPKPLPVQTGQLPSASEEPNAPSGQLPGKVQTRKVAPKPVVASEVANPGDLICGQCGVPNSPQRKFCRKCGTSMGDAVKVAQAVPAVADEKLSWWKRLWVRRPTGVLPAGSRHERRSGRFGSAARRVLQALVAALALAAGLGLVGPWRDDVRKFGQDVRLKILPRYEKVLPIDALAFGPDGNPPGKATLDAEHHESTMYDNFANTCWAEGRRDAGQGMSIIFTFAKAIHLSEIRIAGGTPGEGFQSQPQPHDIVLYFLAEDGKKQVAPKKNVSLEKTRNGELQPVKINVKRVKMLTIGINSVFDGVGNQKNPVTTICDIEFIAKK